MCLIIVLTVNLGKMAVVRFGSVVMMVAMVSSVAASLAAPPSLRFATSYGNSMVLQRAPQAGEFERVTRLVTMTCFGIAPLTTRQLTTVPLLLHPLPVQRLCGDGVRNLRAPRSQ